MSWRRYLRRDYWDRERSSEIDFYLEIETADNITRGMTAADAAAAARRKFGNRTIVREEIYRMNTVSWLESVVQDLRFGVRLLLLNPIFTVVAILSLALGIGANTAIFQLVDAVLLRSLPVQKPNELVKIAIAGGNGGMGVNGAYGDLTRPIWQQIQREHAPFSGVFAWSKPNVHVGEGSTLEQVNGIAVSGDFFRVLGVEAWRGRVLLPADEHPCPNSTAIVSYAYWQSKLAGSPIGTATKLLVDGQLMQIVGVTPPSFFGLAVGEGFDIAVPFCQPRELERNVFDVSVMGRLRPGWTMQSASSQLAAISPGIMAATEISGYTGETVQRYRKFKLSAYSAAEGVSYLRENYDSSLWLLLGISGLVLLIACANLANLMLARASTREREVAVRLALGAARIRLLRQLLVESSLLAAIGAALGVGLAAGLSRVLVWALSPGDNAVILPVQIDSRVLLFTAGVATLTCVIFGIAPAIRASGVDPVTAMKTGGRSLTAGREHFSLQRLLVVMQISVSLILLVGALLFVGSFRNLLDLDPGMREHGVTVAFIGFNDSKIPTAQMQEFERQLLDEIRSVPGVSSAATTTNVPLFGGSWGHTIDIAGKQGGSMFTWVSPGYFDTMGIPLLKGRGFNPTDSGVSQRVAVVNQTFVRDLLGGADPLGRTMRTHPEPGYPSTVYQIVGVIPDTKYSCLRCGIPPMTFAPAAQFPSPHPWTAMVIYSKQPAAAVIASVKRNIASRHPEIFAQFRVFETQIRDSLVQERLMAMLSGFFGVLAAILGMVGLYGVISYIVTRRRGDIGIRLALGASRGQVVGMVMREAGLLLLIGIAAGTALAFVAGRSVNSLLFGLKPYDPVTLVVSISLLAVVGAAASFLPARRAAALNPMTALRSE
jgi:predicted permease